MRDIYLDNAATTRVRPEVVAVMNEYMLNDFGNPSSPHAKGLAAETAVRRAREQIATALRVDRDEVHFTSGGTEANNLAIKGVARRFRRQGGNVVCLATEHPSVIEAMRDLQDEGFTVRLAPVSKSGEVDLATLDTCVDTETRLVSVAYVNNEIGTVQPIEQLAKRLRSINRQVTIHVDAVQALGKLPLTPRLWGVDAVSISGHKIHGPKGIGALYVRRGLRLQALFGGGQQESGLRSGTENVPGIVGFCEAVQLAMRDLDAFSARLRGFRHLLIQELAQRITGVQVVGPTLEDAAPHIVNVSIPGIKGEVMVRLLSDASLYVSTGSACSTKKHAKSHVLSAIGLDAAAIDTSLRISFGHETTEHDIREAAERIARAHEDLVRWQR